MPVEIVGYEVVEAGSPPSFSSWVVHQNWTENDIIEEYEKYKDKKKVAKIYGITTQQVTEILKRNV
ncbi:hypothetical protein [Mediterraneibacter gnavus]|jgi:abortive infection bacteriophage resistance protein|uniref:Uncharacterized protein n=1 Tax=Mediterraneibacter gnavus (strain ATCC 29149 / DSM 114966 / JCM 6515 / VPI C7-9) TaxID=411470 RepID=A7AXM9_MEDG7|nr:hypothetical protein [Mediterraneibacter gnavus]EDN79530.1 hypothetical protein RUMGNA_00041 [Mediterraneibacter gnavus ATCC 29149]PQL30841.1 hypothetical protein C5Y99_02655 [Mediterraneibacter gnavus ATCC 29149]QEI33123.1 hypothetical protein FXV78_14975 [Mediterraneibacter gnavus ATCC 29149]QHB22456.1 hypothetical protein RGna_02590 [Mediterraneibacter gnavus ATCC 29149]UZT20928.1 hypothetical protein ORL52_15120 [Mediterraneibacter gnavus]